MKKIIILLSTLLVLCPLYSGSEEEKERLYVDAIFLDKIAYITGYPSSLSYEEKREIAFFLTKFGAKEKEIYQGKEYYEGYDLSEDKKRIDYIYRMEGQERKGSSFMIEERDLNGDGNREVLITEYCSLYQCGNVGMRVSIHEKRGNGNMAVILAHHGGYNIIDEKRSGYQMIVVSDTGFGCTPYEYDLKSRSYESLGERGQFNRVEQGRKECEGYFENSITTREKEARKRARITSYVPIIFHAESSLSYKDQWDIVYEWGWAYTNRKYIVIEEDINGDEIKEVFLKEIYFDKKETECVGVFFKIKDKNNKYEKVDGGCDYRTKKSPIKYKSKIKFKWLDQDRSEFPELITYWSKDDQLYCSVGKYDDDISKGYRPGYFSIRGEKTRKEICSEYVGLSWDITLSFE